jgi:hypothetical protein
VRRILERIGSAEPSARAEALLEVFVLAGLRKLAPIVGEEAESMPLLNDIMEHEVLGPKLRAARQGGEREVITWQAETRFGALPLWAQRRLEAMTVEELKITALRLLDAHSIEELFR